MKQNKVSPKIWVWLPDYEVYRLEYQNQRFLVKSMIKNAIIDYYFSQINESAGNKQKLFTVFNNLLHKSKIPVLPFQTLMSPWQPNLLTFFIKKMRTFGKLSMIQFLMFLLICVSSILSLPHNLTCFVPTDEKEIRKVVMKSPSTSTINLILYQHHWSRKKWMS